MKVRVFFALAVLLSCVPHAVRAQSSTTAPNATRREMAIERRDAIRSRHEARAAMTPEQHKALKADRQARIAAMSPEQQQFLTDRRAYQQELRTIARDLRAQVNAGAITRDAMAKQLKAYRDAHRPTRPAGMAERQRKP